MNLFVVKLNKNSRVQLVKRMKKEYCDDKRLKYTEKRCIVTLRQGYREKQGINLVFKQKGEICYENKGSSILQ